MHSAARHYGCLLGRLFALCITCLADLVIDSGSSAFLAKLNWPKRAPRRATARPKERRTKRERLLAPDGRPFMSLLIYVALRYHSVGWSAVQMCLRVCFAKPAAGCRPQTRRCATTEESKGTRDFGGSISSQRRLRLQLDERER